MKKIIWGLLIVLSFSYIDVFAIDKCTNEEMTRLNELAKNVQFKTTNQIVDENEKGEWVDVKYKIEIVNFDEDLKIIYNDGNQDVTLKSKDTIIDNLLPQKMQFQIYSYTDNLCTEELLRTANVDLPNYNAYYYFHKDKCQEHLDFKYCKEYISVSDMTFEEIDEEFTKYLNENTGVAAVLKSNNKWYFIVGGCLLGLITIILILLGIMKKKKKEPDDL